MEIAATIIAMGHILDFKALAEGVKTRSNWYFYRKKAAIAIKAISKAGPYPQKGLLNYCAINNRVYKTNAKDWSIQQLF